MDILALEIPLFPLSETRIFWAFHHFFFSVCPLFNIDFASFVIHKSLSIIASVPNLWILEKIVFSEKENKK